MFLVYVVPTHMVCLSQTYRSGFAFPLQASNCLGIEFWLVDETEKAYTVYGKYSPFNISKVNNSINIFLRT